MSAVVSLLPDDNSHFPPTIKSSKPGRLRRWLFADSAGDIFEMETPSGRPSFWQIIDLC